MWDHRRHPAGIPKALQAAEELVAETNGTLCCNTVNTLRRHPKIYAWTHKKPRWKTANTLRVRYQLPSQHSAGYPLKPNVYLMGFQQADCRHQINAPGYPTVTCGSLPKIERILQKHAAGSPKTFLVPLNTLRVPSQRIPYKHAVGTLNTLRILTNHTVDFSEHSTDTHQTRFWNYIDRLRLPHKCDAGDHKHPAGPSQMSVGTTETLYGFSQTPFEYPPNTLLIPYNHTVSISDHTAGISQTPRDYSQIHCRYSFKHAVDILQGGCGYIPTTLWAPLQTHCRYPPNTLRIPPNTLLVPTNTLLVPPKHGGVYEN